MIILNGFQYSFRPMPLPYIPILFFLFFVFSLFFYQSIFLFFYIYIFLIMYIFLGNVVVYCLTRRSWRVGRPRTPTSIPFAPGANRELCLLFQYRYLYWYYNLRTLSVHGPVLVCTDNTICVLLRYMYRYMYYVEGVVLCLLKYLLVLVTCLFL